MSIRLLLALTLVLLVSQIQSAPPFQLACNATQFTFFNDLEIDAQFYQLMKWDYSLAADQFEDGTRDTFDGFLRLSTGINSIGQFYNNKDSLYDYRCDLDHISDAENPYAFAEYRHAVDLGDIKLNVTRNFYAPINENWIRIIDTFSHSSTESQNLTAFYTGYLGSDQDTVYDALSDYYIASSDGFNGTNDPLFGMNFAGQGGLRPTKTRFIIDSFNWNFDTILAPGKQVSIMHILSQYRSATESVNGVKRLMQQPSQIYQNLDEAIISQIINWDLCGAAFNVVSETTCVTPAQITFRTNTAGTNLTLSTVGNVVVPQSGEISLELASGTYEFSWQRAPVCSAKTHSFTVKAPQENLAVTVKNSGNFQASATGGYGSYKYEWILNGDNLSSAFDNGATVVVTDAQGCTANITVDLPALTNNGPAASIVSAGSSISALPAIFLLLANAIFLD